MGKFKFFNFSFILIYYDESRGISHMVKNDVFNARSSFEANGKRYHYYRLSALEEAGIGKVSNLPY
jgi:hypothetical protein